MPVRQTYQYNAPSGNNGGLILDDPADIKCWSVGDVTLEWALDRDGSNRLRLGDNAAIHGQSLVVVPYGGFGLVGRNLVSGANAITKDDCVLRVDTTGGSATLNLPAAATMADQFLDIYKMVAVNSVIIDPNGAETINGDLTYTFSGNRSPVRIRSNGASWEIFLSEARLNNLIGILSPLFSTNSAAYVTVATSASVYFSGRPVMFDLSFGGRNTNAINESFGMSAGLRFDAGADIDVIDWTANITQDHRITSGAIILTPTQGFHTVDFRIRKLFGAGTFDIDLNDFIRLTSIEF